MAVAPPRTLVVMTANDLPSDAQGLLPRRRALPTGRVVAGSIAAALSLPALTFGITHARQHIALPSVLLLYLLLIVGVGSIGGVVPALVSALAASLLVNWFFTPPFHTLTIQHAQNAFALLVFVVVAVVISTLVSKAARRRNESARARWESEALARAAATLVGRDDPVPELMASLCETFGLEAIALLRRGASGWRVEAHAGTPCPLTPDDGTSRLDLSVTSCLVAVGPPLTPDDCRVLRTFAAPIAAALESRRLHVEAAAAQRLAEANELRTAILAAVSHDLRTPLSSIKASVTSLLQAEVEWSPDTTREFLETIDSEADRLNKIVGNLLDMSRLQTGGVNLSIREIGLDEVVAVALSSLGARARGQRIVVDVAESLPPVLADPALLERAIANLVDNALIHAHGDQPIRLEGVGSRDRVHLRIIDRGPGIPAPERERAFRAFQRLGDRPKGLGVGLGLAVARGFVEAMGAALLLDDTPGGGLTVDVDLKAAA